MARAPAPVVAEEAVVEEAPVEEMAAEETAQPVVVLTVLRAADGSFTLEVGDEPEDGAEPAMATEGKSYAPDEDGVGALMAAILDLVDPENAESPQAQANFNAGYSGEETPPAAA